MKLTQVSAFAAVAFITLVARAEVSVQPIALTIGSPSIEDMDFGFKPNGVDSGTSVHILVSGLDQPIVKLDDDASTLDSAVDSTGKDLLAKPEKKNTGFSFSSGSSNIGPFPSVSEDGSAMIVELTTPQTPAQGATHIEFAGNLSVLAAAGKKTVSAKGVAMQPGNIDIGGKTIKIEGVEPNQWDPSKHSLKLVTNTAMLDAIAAWKISGPNGELLSDGPQSTMTMNTTVHLELPLDSKPNTFDIELELYDGMQKVTVPVTFKAGLGIE